MKAPKDAAEFKGLEQVAHGLNYYRRVNRQLLQVVVSLSVIAACTTFSTIFFAFRGPVNKYFEVSQEFKLQQLIPLERPTVTDSKLRNWVQSAVTETLDLNFAHYRKNLENVRDYYTPECFNQLVNSLSASGNLKFVTDKRLVVSATPLNTPVIVNRGLISGVYTWDLQLPIRVSYESSQGNVSVQNNMALIRVIRISVAENPLGIAITQFILQ